MIQLFHAGTSHVINGVTCESMLVNEFGFEHYLDEGWFLTPQECYAEEKEKKLEADIAKTKRELKAVEALEKIPKKKKSLSLIKAGD